MQDLEYYATGRPPSPKHHHHHCLVRTSTWIQLPGWCQREGLKFFDWFISLRTVGHAFVVVHVVVCCMKWQAVYLVGRVGITLHDYILLQQTGRRDPEIQKSMD